MLTLVRQWSADGRAFARWSAASQALLRRLKWDLGQQLKGVLSPRCAHVRGRGGVKGAVRYIDRRLERYPFVARFDIRAYYESMDHAVLLGQLRDAGVGLAAQAAVREYLAKPDLHATGKGMVAGGAISPLLAALYLTPLDWAMEVMELRLGIFYQRFMDDWVILAPSRHKLRAALRVMYEVLTQLQLEVHPNKRFIGRTTRGFDFLGYRLHPGRKLRPSQQSLDRMVARARQLHEQRASHLRLREYVQRWFIWLHGGLRGRVSRKGRFHQIWIRVLTRLRALDAQTPHP